MPKVYNKRDPEVPAGAVYVGRPTKWGNPYVLGKHGDRDKVIARFEEFVEFEPEFEAEIKEHLKGKDLVCWCAPLPCHADILLRVANEE